MSPFDALTRAALGTIQGVFGSLTAFVYSRPQSGSFNVIPAFSIQASLNAGGDYAGPTGVFSGLLLVRCSDIALGPQKGDLVAIAAAPAPMKSGTYRVQEIYQDAPAGWANLLIRSLQ